MRIFFSSAFLIFFFLPLILVSQTRTNLRQEGVKQIQQGLYLEALNTLNDAIRYESSASDLYFFRGYAKYGLDDFIGAEIDYTRSLELFPYQPDVYINRAIVRSQQEKLKGAFEDFSSALELDSTNVTIYINRARINLFSKNFNACIKYRIT